MHLKMRRLLLRWKISSQYLVIKLFWLVFFGSITKALNKRLQCTQQLPLLFHERIALAITCARSERNKWKLHTFPFHPFEIKLHLFQSRRQQTYCALFRSVVENLAQNLTHLCIDLRNFYSRIDDTLLALKSVLHFCVIFKQCGAFIFVYKLVAFVKWGSLCSNRWSPPVRFRFAASENSYELFFQLSIYHFTCVFGKSTAAVCLKKWVFINLFV